MASLGRPYQAAVTQKLAKARGRSQLREEKLRKAKFPSSYLCDAVFRSFAASALHHRPRPVWRYV